MDELDFRVIAELVRTPFASHANIGRALGLTGTTVKSRLDGMVRRGAIAGFLVVPSAATLRRIQKLYPFHNVDPEPPLERILDVDDVVAVARANPGTLIVNTFEQNAGAHPPPAITDAIGGTPERATLTDTPTRGDSSSILSPLDWRVADALLEDPRAKLTELARKARLTATTVRRRRDALVERGLLHVAPIVDTRREDGLVVYSGYAWLSGRSVAEKIHSPGLASIWVHHDPPGVSIFGAMPNYAAVEQFEHELRDLPGVLRAELTAARGGVLATGRLRKWIREEIARWSGTRPGEGG